MTVLKVTFKEKNKPKMIKYWTHFDRETFIKYQTK
jgi:hypothetical protein